MSQVVLLRPRAVKDLESIYNHSVKEWGVNTADRYIFKLEESFQKLAENAFLGKTIDEVSPGLRMFPVASHIVFYRAMSTGISIVRILHGAMDETRHL